MPARPVTVTLGRQPYAGTAKVATHAFNIDEPRDSGGGDKGPTPIELLLSALASCKAITAKMYADRKAWPLDGVEASTLAVMNGYAITSIEVELRFSGALDDEQRHRLLEIAERCPVQKALTAGVQVTSRLAT